MFQAVEIYSAAGVLKHRFELNGDRSQPYFIQKIDGLGPVTASLGFSPVAGQDAETIQSAKVGKRNIVMSLGFRERASSIQTLRQALYSSMFPKAPIILRFFSSDLETVEIAGTVESNTPTIFDQKPSTQISIINPRPYFKALQPRNIPSFNNTLIDPKYVGNAPTGFVLSITASRTVPSFTLQNGIDPDLVFDGEFLSGDTITISTVEGDKYVRRIRDGAVTSQLDGIANGTLSQQISPQVASFMVKMASFADLPVKLSYIPKYVGI